MPINPPIESGIIQQCRKRNRVNRNTTSANAMSEVSMESEYLAETVEAWLRDSINHEVSRDNDHVGGNGVAGRHCHPTGSGHLHSHCHDLECV